MPQIVPAEIGDLGALQCMNPRLVVRRVQRFSPERKNAAWMLALLPYQNAEGGLVQRYGNWSPVLRLRPMNLGVPCPRLSVRNYKLLLMPNNVNILQKT